jgi:hypothetical protein
MRAVAPAGGCTDLVNSITTIVKDTAQADATNMTSSKAVAAWLNTLKHETPTKAPIVFPTMQFQGCARGAFGTANTRTAWAPKLPEEKNSKVSSSYV